jgi:quinol monooxygenase YgiN
MVTERADIGIVAGREAEFETAMRERGCALLRRAAGCLSVSLSRCVERSGRYELKLEWESISHHTDFTHTPDFTLFRDLAGPFFSERPAVEHFERVFPQ